MLDNELHEDVWTRSLDDRVGPGVLVRNPLPPGLADIVLDALPYGVIVLDHAGRVAAANATWGRIARRHGAPDLAEWSAGRDYLEVSRRATGLGGAEAESAAAGIRDVLERGLPEFTLEYPARPLDRREWFLLRAARLPRAAAWAVVTHVDISERKLAEEERARLLAHEQAARAAAEARAGELDATVEAMTDGVLVCDAEQRVIRANRAYRDMMATLDVPGDDVAPPRERTAHLAIHDGHGRPLPPEQWPIPRLLQGEVLRGATTVDLPAHTPEGREVRFNLGGAPLRDPGGRIRGAVAVLRDVTEQRHMARRTHEALDALLAMARALTGPRAGAEIGRAHGADRLTRRIVRAAGRVLGCERIMLMGVHQRSERLQPLASVGWRREVEERWHAEFGQLHLRDYLSPGLRGRLRAGEVIACDLTDAAARGLPTYGVSRLLLVPLRLGSRLVGALGLDYGTAPHHPTAAEHALLGVTARLAALALQRDKLLRERREGRAREVTLHETAQHMEDFLATAGHDLRSPLTAVVGTIDLAALRFERVASMLADLASGPEVARAIDAVRRSVENATQSADRLTRLVNLLFDTSQARTGTIELRREPCDLVAVVRDQIEALRATRPRHRLRLDAPAERSLMVTADAIRIGQVVANYLTNAAKYSKERASIAVRVQVAGQMARVAVRDHGPGLPAAQQTLVWQRFYRVPGVHVQSGSVSGLGMGLHICKTIVEGHGGRVGVESEAGRGSTFWFTLPLARA